MFCTFDKKKLLAAITKLHFMLPEELFKEFFIETLMVLIFFGPPGNFFILEEFLWQSLDFHSTCAEDGFEERCFFCKVIFSRALFCFKATLLALLAKICSAESWKLLFRCPEFFRMKRDVEITILLPFFLGCKGTLFGLLSACFRGGSGNYIPRAQIVLRKISFFRNCTNFQSPGHWAEVFDLLAKYLLVEL